MAKDAISKNINRESGLIKNGFSQVVHNSLAVLTCALLVIPQIGFGNPQGGVVAAGNATISTPSPGTMQINQSTNKAIINWQSYNISSQEHVHYQQPNSSSITLNRINPNNGPSQIFGKLTANGQVLLVNPAGIWFGPSAYVNVAGLLATTANISDQDFMAGRYSFKQSRNWNGAVINNGMIKTSGAGLLALVGSGVVNNGHIEANLGTVILASGSEFTLNFSGNDLISFTVDREALKPARDQNGNPLSDGVQNTGIIIANGGKILMTARTAGQVLDNAINMSGIAEAKSVGVKNGEIILSGENQGIVKVSGKIIASGKNAGETGGKVKVLGNKVALTSNATIDVSGDSGGGIVFIGGNAHGAGPEQNASNTYIAPGVSIAANAVTNGDGGNIVVWSDIGTQFYGNIEARGGKYGGDGGWVEVSGKQNLYFEGTVNTLAPHGKIGTLLLDPKNIIVATGGAATLSNVDQFSDTPGATLTIAPATINAALANVVLQANNDITFSNPISLSAGISFTAQAGRSILLNASITANNANILLSANDLSAILANRDPGLGSISGTGALITTLAGTVTLQVGSNANAGNITTGAITSANGLVSVSTPRTISVNGNITNTGGGASLNAGADLNVLTNISTGAGAINLTSGGTLTINRSGTNHNITNSGPLTLSGNNIVISNTLSNNNTSIVSSDLMTINATQDFTIFGRGVGGVGGFTRVRGASQNVTVGNNLTITMGTGLTGVNNFGELVSTAGTQTINAGSILLQSSAQGTSRIQAAGTQNISATTGGITLTGNGPSTTARIANLSAAALNLTSATTINSNGYGTISATTVNLNSQGNITQLNNTDVLNATNLNIQNPTGTTSLISTSNTVANLGAQSISGNVSLTSSGNINMIATNIGSGTLNLTAGGDITQTGMIVSNGLTLALTAAGKNISLGNFANNFGPTAVSIIGNTANVANVSLRNANAGAQLGNFSTLTQLQQLTVVYDNAGFILNNPITANASGNAIILAGTSFVNNIGSNALMTPNGSYQIWSGSPLTDNRGDLSYQFKQYGATYGISTVLGTGNGFLYTLTPILTPQLIGTVQKTYDKSAVAILTPSNYSLVGAIDGDTILATLPATGSYAQVNVGNNINVTATGISIPSSPNPNAVNNGADVYGYQLSSTTASGNIGEILPATLTYLANTASRVYGNANPTFNGTVTGFVIGDNQANATTGTLAFLSLATPTSNVGNYAIDGSGLTANNGNYNFVQAVGNATALTIGQRSLNFTGTRLYDGTPNFTAAQLMASNIVNSDVINLSGSATTVSPNVGVYNSFATNNLISSNLNYSVTGGTIAVSITPQSVPNSNPSTIIGSERVPFQLVFPTLFMNFVEVYIQYPREEMGSGCERISATIEICPKDWFSMGNGFNGLSFE